jgi:hypothetical protein
MRNVYKTVVIIYEDKKDETVFTVILEEVGVSVWGEFKWHDVNLHLAFVNKVLYFQAL